MIGLVGHTTTIYHGTPYQGLNFQPTMRRKSSREANIHRAQYPSKGNWQEASICDTQADVPST